MDKLVATSFLKNSNVLFPQLNNSPSSCITYFSLLFLSCTECNHFVTAHHVDIHGDDCKRIMFSNSLKVITVDSVVWKSTSETSNSLLEGTILVAPLMSTSFLSKSKLDFLTWQLQILTAPLYSKKTQSGFWWTDANPTSRMVCLLSLSSPWK